MRTLSHPLLISLCLGIVVITGFPDDAYSHIFPSNSKAKVPSTILGNYYKGGGYGGPSIKLLGDGEYVLFITSDVATDGTKESGGNYTLANGVLVLRPRYSAVSMVEQNPPFNTVRTSHAVSGPILRYLSVRWGERLYLLEQGKDEIRFCNAINLGDEPLPKRFASAHQFMMRQNDGKKPVTGKPPLPAPWSRYLLSRPVKAKIVRVQKGYPTSTVTLNVGSANNIRIGMEFTDNRRHNFFTVTSVTAHQAILKAYGTTIHTGDFLSTHRNRKLWNR